MGARLVLVGRDAGRLERTRLELLAEVPGLEAVSVVADMASLASVRAAAAEILEREPRIDVIVDNAGAMIPEREVTDEGFERTFAIMVLGPFTLVSRLLPRLLESPDGRLVAVTSGGQYTQALPLDDLAYERGDVPGRQVVRPGEAGPGGADPRVGAPAAGHRCRRQRDAPRLGQHARPRGVPARVRRARRGPAAVGRRGRGHRALARGCPGCAGIVRPAVPDRRERPFDRIPSTRLSAADRANLWNAVVEMTGEADPAPGMTPAIRDTMR